MERAERPAGQPPHAGPLRQKRRPVLALVDALNKAIAVLVAVLLAAMCVCAFVQVIVRLLLGTLGVNLSVPWSEELGRCFMIWLIFLGCAYACRSAQMISLTFVSDQIPRFLHRYADAVTALICVAFYALLVRVGLKAMEFGWFEMSPVLQFPKAYVYLAMPVGAAVMIVNTLALLIERGVFEKTYRRTGAAEDALAPAPDGAAS